MVFGGTPGGQWLPHKLPWGGQALPHSLRGCPTVVGGLPRDPGAAPQGPLGVWVCPPPQVWGPLGVLVCPPSGFWGSPYLFLAISFCLLTFSSSNSRMFLTPISRQNSSNTSSSTLGRGGSMSALQGLPQTPGPHLVPHKCPPKNSSTHLVHLLLQVLHLPLPALDDPFNIINARPKIGQFTLQFRFLLRGGRNGGQRMPRTPTCTPKSPLWSHTDSVTPMGKAYALCKTPETATSELLTAKSTPIMRPKRV